MKPRSIKLQQKKAQNDKEKKKETGIIKCLSRMTERIFFLEIGYIESQNIIESQYKF